MTEEDEDTRAIYEGYCGMTCFGGSEQKRCPCDGPSDCRMRNHPDYPRYRVQAAGFMLAMMRGTMERKCKR